MSGTEDEDIFKHLMKIAVERWGEDEAKTLKPYIKVMVDFVRKVDEYSLDPFNEPAKMRRDELDGSL